MSILSTIKETLFNKYNVKDITGISTAISPEMAEHIELWNQILAGSAPWNEEAKPCGITEAIAGALSDPISEEVDVSAKSEELNNIIYKLNEDSTEIVQDIVLCGGGLVRPIYANGKLQYEIIKLGNYIPTSYDFDGTLTGALILKSLQKDNDHYILIERHNYEGYVDNESQKHRHTVSMELYKCDGYLKRVPLYELEATANLTESYAWEDVSQPMIIEFRNRKPNKIDGSLVPVPLYAGFENLIKDADEQYQRINWEQESAKRIIFADEDLFNKRQQQDNGASKVKLGKLRQLLVKIQGSRINAEQGIETFSPEIRTSQMKEAYQEILRRLELACNIGKGTLSDLEAVAQTATQYTGGKKALYTAIDSIESELEEKYHNAAYVFAYMLSAYAGVPFDDEIEISFNDSSRKDEQQQKLTAMQEVNAGLMNPWEYRMRFYNEDEATAKANAPEPVASNNFGGFYGE